MKSWLFALILNIAAITDVIGFGTQRSEFQITNKKQYLTPTFGIPRESVFRLYSTPPSPSNNEDSESSSEVSPSGEEFVESMSEDRKATLFQFLLRDLQIEGIPLLGCDADQVHNMLAAIWTIMSELSEQELEQKTCLVLEAIPMDALKAFVDDFSILQTQRRLMDHLPELERFSVTLVGKGVGPALLIETTNRTEAEIEEVRERTEAFSDLEEFRSIAAMKTFVARMMDDEWSLPTVAHRFSDSTDICASLALFWNSICELLSQPEEAMSGAFLSLPGMAPGISDSSHNRFVAVSELISRSLCLYRGNDVFELDHYHPAYDRDLVHPTNKPAFGHLPPRSWIRPMIEKSSLDSSENALTDDQLKLSDYQRRSPHTAVHIMRASSLLTDPADGIMDLDLGNGQVVEASGIETYSRAAVRMAEEGKENLEAALEKELAI